MLTPFEEELVVGSRFADRFQIQGVVGRGSMGIVYQARHELMARTVAIKMLRGQLASDERSIRRFEREARAASRMDHPNLIAVHDFGLTENRQPYLVMDFAQGYTLYEVQRREEHITPVRAVRIFTQACDALQHAHLQGVIHRDLKPSNIMLIEKDGEPDFVKVFDLGIAKIAWGEEEDREPLTRTNEVCGSPIYLSPEQCKHLTLDCRSDIYSMGVLMYELLTGVPPLMGETVYDTIYMHVHEQPRPFAQVRSDLHIPSRMERIVFKALEKDPEHRYQSMQELKWELQASLQASDPHLQVLPPELLTPKRKKSEEVPAVQPPSSYVSDRKTPAAGMMPLPPVAPVPPATAAAAAHVTPQSMPVTGPRESISAGQAALVSSVVTVVLTLAGVGLFLLMQRNAPTQEQPAPTVASRPPHTSAAVNTTLEPKTRSQPRSVPPRETRLETVPKAQTPAAVAHAPAAKTALPAKSSQPGANATAHKATPATRAISAKHAKLTAEQPLLEPGTPAPAPSPSATAPGNPFFSIFQGFSAGSKQEATTPMPAFTATGSGAARRAPQQSSDTSPAMQPGYQTYQPIAMQPLRAPVPQQYQQPNVQQQQPTASAYQPSDGSSQGPRRQMEQVPAMTDGPSPEAIAALNEGISVMANDPARAIQKFQQALHAYPGYTKAKRNLGRAKVNLGNRLLESDRQKAIRLYKEAMDIFRSNGDTDDYQKISTFYNQLTGSY